MRRMRGKLLAAGAAFAMLILPAQAQVTRTEMLVVGRTLGFVDNLTHHSPVHVGIVYDPNDAQSTQQANEIKAMLGNGLRIGTLIFQPVMQPLTELGKAHVEALFLTSDLGARAAAVKTITRTRKIPCITADIAQVRNGVCALGVRIKPKVEVLLNRAAADASNLDLAAVFRIMIVEI